MNMTVVYDKYWRTPEVAIIEELGYRKRVRYNSISLDANYYYIGDPWTTRCEGPWVRIPDLDDAIERMVLKGYLNGKPIEYILHIE